MVFDVENVSLNLYGSEGIFICNTNSNHWVKLKGRLSIFAIYRSKWWVIDYDYKDEWDDSSLKVKTKTSSCPLVVHCRMALLHLLNYIGKCTLNILAMVMCNVVYRWLCFTSVLFEIVPQCFKNRMKHHSWQLSHTGHWVRWTGHLICFSG